MCNKDAPQERNVKQYKDIYSVQFHYNVFKYAKLEIFIIWEYEHIWYRNTREGSA